MAHIVNSSQQITHAVLAPQSIHSRVTGFWTGALPVIGDTGQESTFPLAANLRLLSVDLKFKADIIGTQCSAFWFLTTGTKKPNSADEVLNSWEPIIPSSSGIKPFFRWDGDEAHFYWKMNRFYTGAGRRFGLWFNNITAVRWWVQATFEISEG